MAVQLEPITQAEHIIDSLDDLTRRHVRRALDAIELKAERTRARLLADAERYAQLRVDARSAERAWTDHVHGGDCETCNTPGDARCAVEHALDRACEAALASLRTVANRLGIEL